MTTTAPALPADLPGCGRVATRRIEIYSHASGQNSTSLDGAVHTCDGHVEPVRDAIHAAGFTPHSVPLGALGYIRCGSGTDFTGATVPFWSAPEATDPTTVTTHPIWCLRRDCAEHGEHRSRSMTATPSGTDGVTVRVSLAQTVHPAAGVRIALGVDGVIVELSVSQVRTLGWLLRRIVSMIGHDDRGRS
jgi:hypothetical protein